MLRNIRTRIPFTSAAREESKTDKDLAAVTEALAGNRQEEAEDLLRDVALTQNKGARWSVGIMVTDEGIRVVQRTPYKISRMVRFSEKQIDSLKQSLDVIAANPSVKSIGLLADIKKKAWNRVYAMDNDRVRDIEGYALDKTKQAIQSLMKSDVEAGFQSVTNYLKTNPHTMDDYHVFLGYKVNNLQRLIDKNHDMGMAELGYAMVSGFRGNSKKLQDLFKTYIDDPALFSKNKFIWTALQAPTPADPAAADEIVLSDATQQKILDKLARAYAPDRQDDAKAVETIKSILDVMPAVDEWAYCREGERRYRSNDNADKISGLLNKSLSDYFTQVAAAAPEKAVEVFIAAATDFTRTPVYTRNFVNGEQYESPVINSETAGTLMDAFNDLSRGIISGAGWNKAIEVAARIRDTGGVPDRIRDFAGDAVKKWTLPPGNG